MMSPGTMCFREMALLNIAFAHSQLGEGEQAKECYKKTLEQFPHNGMAGAALKLIASVDPETKKAIPSA